MHNFGGLVIWREFVTMVAKPSITFLFLLLPILYLPRYRAWRASMHRGAWCAWLRYASHAGIRGCRCSHLASLCLQALCALAFVVLVSAIHGRECVHSPFNEQIQHFTNLDDQTSWTKNGHATRISMSWRMRQDCFNHTLIPSTPPSTRQVLTEHARP